MSLRKPASSSESLCCLCVSSSLNEHDMGGLKKGQKYNAHYYCLVRVFVLYINIPQKKTNGGTENFVVLFSKAYFNFFIFCYQNS